MVILHTIKTVNGWDIAKRSGVQTRVERLALYLVIHPSGRIMKEFRRLASAEKWCRENNDVSKQCPDE